MKRLLLNGCSYTHGWNPTEWFAGYEITNLAIRGGSNLRIFRTTIDWILKNGNPDFVITPITYPERNEFILRGDTDYTLINVGYFTHTDKELEKLLPRYDYYINDIYHLDKLFIDMLTFSAFLKQRKIPHLMFDMCNHFSEDHPYLFCDASPFFANKIKTIEQHPNIIDFFNFCGNIYLSDNNAAMIPEELALYSGKPIHRRALHYNKNDFFILEKYLDTYRKKVEQHVE